MKKVAEVHQALIVIENLIRAPATTGTVVIVLVLTHACAVLICRLSDVNLSYTKYTQLFISPTPTLSPSPTYFMYSLVASDNAVSLAFPLYSIAHHHNEREFADNIKLARPQALAVVS
jgi:hypothetical protein